MEFFGNDEGRSQHRSDSDFCAQGLGVFSEQCFRDAIADQAVKGFDLADENMDLQNEFDVRQAHGGRIDLMKCLVGGSEQGEFLVIVFERGTKTGLFQEIAQGSEIVDLANVVACMRNRTNNKRLDIVYDTEPIENTI